ncbi:unnamed protein product [Amoebophrya sp. A120]|nr:unnamed protein product [Amoebophrya sp. A120]|eukprot:GSA120T00000526001.1
MPAPRNSTNGRDSVSGRQSTKPASAKRRSQAPDRVSQEADLAKKMGLERPTAYAVVDTNVIGGRRSAMLDKYKEGELESLFIDKVKERDIEWVKHTLSQCGRELFLSPYAGGIIKTSILYAAESADENLCKLLVRYGGKELLLVKNFKGRDARYFAEKNGIDIGKLSTEATVDCWNLNTLNGLQGAKRASEKLSGVHRPERAALRTSFASGVTRILCSVTPVLLVFQHLNLRLIR